MGKAWLWGWPVRERLLREVWESLISLYPPLISLFRPLYPPAIKHKSSSTERAHTPRHPHNSPPHLHFSSAQLSSDSGRPNQPVFRPLNVVRMQQKHIGEVLKRVKKIQLEKAYKIENWK